MLENSLRNDFGEQTSLAAQRTFLLDSDCFVGIRWWHVIATLLLIRFEIGGYQAL